MSAISLKSITGITSITTPAGVDNQLTLHNNNTSEAVKLDTAGNLHFHNHLNITGISTAANFKTGTSNLHSTGLNIFDLDVDGHTNLDNVSVAGFTTFAQNINVTGSVTGTSLVLNAGAPTIFLNDTDANSDFSIQANSGLLKFMDTTNSYAVRLSINSSGKVSIGNNASPDGKLHVYSSSAGTVTADADGDELVLESSGNTGLSILSPGTGESTIFFGNPGTNGQKDAWIKYYHETHSTTANRRALTLRTSGGERLRIDSTGALRINNTRTTATKLHVVGGTASGTAYDAAVFAGGQNSTSGSGVKLYLSGCENDPLSRGVILESIMTDNSNAHRFSILVGGSSAAPTERFRITPSGVHFYGNQTNLPNGIFGFRYDKNNDTDLSIENLNNSSVNNNAGIRLASNHGNIKLRYFNNGGFYIQNSSDSGYLHYYEGNNSRFYVSTSGNIGINETSPQQLLHVHNDTAYQGILINGNSAPRIAFARTTTTTGEWSVGIDGTNGNQFCINNSNDNSNRKFIISSTQISSLMNHSVSGNLIMANAGSGIDFSATANGGTGTPSELLDDYEEGYFAPEVENLTSGYGSGTFYNRQARYTKVGNMVNCWVHLQWWGNAVTSGNDNTELSITGFPFEIDGVGYSGCCGGGLQSQSWRFSGSGFNNYHTTSDNVQPRINANEQIRFGVFAHNSITGQVTQKSINGYSPNIEFFFSVRVTTYK